MTELNKIEHSEHLEGDCQNCGSYYDNLTKIDGRWLCFGCEMDYGKSVKQLGEEFEEQLEKGNA